MELLATVVILAVVAVLVAAGGVYLLIVGIGGRTLRSHEEGR